MAAPNKLKIGLVLDTSLDPTDGVQQYVLDIGGWLTAQGHDVHYLVGQTEHRQLPNIHSLSRNIGVRFNGNRTTIPLPTSRRKLRQFLKEHRFDILHIQTPHHPLMAQHLVMEADPATAIVGTFHVLPYGRLSRVGNKLLGIWLQPSLKRFDKMLAVSSAAAAWCHDSFKVEAQVLPNVIDYEKFNTAEPFERYDDNKLTIIFLGRLVPRKGCMLLLKAISKLLAGNEKLPAFRIVICGRGPLEHKLKKFVADHDMVDLVEFTGFVSETDKPHYYASADLSVFPSSGGESFGIVLLEAMAGGRTAVLAGDNPGYHSVMEPKPELLFNPEDPAELAAKIKHYLVDASDRKFMADWGAEYAKNYDTGVVGNKLVKIYREALLKRRQL
jgi:phosphatidyl-myo-inositol alpha-mannosyltransferase